MARRGYGYFGWNIRFLGKEAFFVLKHIGAGTGCLRGQGGEAVVVVGNSGGRSLMAAYQSQAIRPTITATRGLTLPDTLSTFPPCDHCISLNAHPGRPEVVTAWMGPAITDERDLLSVDPQLNMLAGLAYVRQDARVHGWRRLSNRAQGSARRRCRPDADGLSRHV